MSDFRPRSPMRLTFPLLRLAAFVLSLRALAAPARLHALGTIEGLGRLAAWHLEVALGDAEPRMIEFALWLAPRFVEQSDSVRQRVLELAGSEGARPRFAVARGQEIFLQACAACHRFRGQGADVGPDITDVRIKPPEMLLFDILDPDNAIDPRWEAISFEAEGGRRVTGIVVSETDDAIIVRGLGGTDTLPRRTITSSKPLGGSLLPQGLEGALPEARMADLLAFLRNDPETK